MKTSKAKLVAYMIVSFWTLLAMSWGLTFWVCNLFGLTSITAVLLKVLFYYDWASKLIMVCLVYFSYVGVEASLETIRNGWKNF